MAESSVPPSSERLYHVARLCVARHPEDWRTVFAPPAQDLVILSSLTEERYRVRLEKLVLAACLRAEYASPWDLLNECVALTGETRPYMAFAEAMYDRVKLLDDHRDALAELTRCRSALLAEFGPVAQTQVEGW